MPFSFSVLAAFGAILCWGLGDFLIQRNVRRVGNTASLFFIGIVAIIGLFPFVWHELPLLIEPQNFMLVLALGIITFVAAMLNFEALKQGKLSVIEVILQIELPVTIIFGMAFFRETLSLQQLAAIGAIFIGVIFMAVKTHQIKNIPKMFEKGVIIGIFGAIAMGVINFLTAATSRQISPAMAIWGPAAVFIFLCVMLMWKRNGFGKLWTGIKKFWLPITAMSIIDNAAWVLFAVATFSGEVGIITAITECYPAIGLFLGIFINRENVEMHQVFGGLLALAASIMLATMA
ncbi:EamA-like transporter family protein [uncultured archaeon]|nr:EamA-like transporter family protein [uncultured archaeon]